MGDRVEQKVDEGRATRLRIAVATWGRFVAWREQVHGGGALLEYALVLAFVVAVVMGSVHFMGPRISSTLDMIANSL